MELDTDYIRLKRCPNNYKDVGFNIRYNKC